MHGLIICSIAVIDICLFIVIHTQWSGLLAQLLILSLVQANNSGLCQSLTNSDHFETYCL